MLNTRTEPVTHFPVAQGGALDPVREQPATAYWVVRVTAGMVLTNTRGDGLTACAWSEPTLPRGGQGEPVVLDGERE